MKESSNDASQDLKLQIKSLFGRKKQVVKKSKDSEYGSDTEESEVIDEAEKELKQQRLAE